MSIDDVLDSSGKVGGETVLVTGVALDEGTGIEAHESIEDRLAERTDELDS